MLPDDYDPVSMMVPTWPRRDGTLWRDDSRNDLSNGDTEKHELTSKLRAATSKTQEGGRGRDATLRRQKDDLEKRLQGEQDRAAAEVSRLQDELLATQTAKSRDAAKIRHALDRAEGAERQVTMLNNRINIGQQSRGPRHVWLVCN